LHSEGLLRALDVSENRLKELVGPLSPEVEQAQIEKLVERFSLICLSTLVEPGDRVAKELVAIVGASKLLTEIAKAASTNEALGIQVVEAQTDTSRRELGLAFDRWLPRFKIKNFRQSLEVLERLECVAVTEGDLSWPKRLFDLGVHAPLLLYTFRKGAHRLGRTDKSVAVVGSRAISPYGRWVTKEFCEHLVRHDIVVVSGGAFGVDAAAHQSTLSVGGETLAIMAGGLDQLYPRGNLSLLHEIRNRGALISEVPPGFAPTKWRFLQRNRLIAAISKATVVVEAGFRSGSINTANHANQLGREVGAVPGPISSVSSSGCHKLIREGKAQLVSSSEELLSLVAGKENFEDSFVRIPDEQLRVFDALGLRGQTEESISVRSGMSLIQCQMALSILELEGLAERKNQKWFRSGRNL